MMRVVHGEFLLRLARAALIRHGDLLFRDGTLVVSVLVNVVVALLHNCFQVLIHGVHSARGVHPTRVFVEPLILSLIHI